MSFYFWNADGEFYRLPPSSLQAYSVSIVMQAQQEIEMKAVTGIYSAPRQHWVGDGFPVRSMFSYNGHGKQLSPFLLLDYAGPAEFAPGTRPPGVGSHPHRGFETVTI
jgi:hypothetical protein